MTTMEMDQTKVEAFAQQVAGVITGGAATAMMVVGDRLGLYAALAQAGPVTSTELAARTGTSERYVREWLAQQAATGFLEYDAATTAFTLPPAHAAVLAGDESPASMIGAAPMVTGMHRRLDELTAAFRSGEGIPWGEQDPTIYESTERFFSVAYRNSLVPDWIPALDGVAAKLSAGASVADVGCGHGAPLIMLAQAFPSSRFTGFDIHPPSVETASQRAVDAGVADRVGFEVNHCQGYPRSGYDLITFFDAFHDLGDPGAAAAHARAALDEGGTLLLVEPRAGDDLASTLATVPMAALGFAASTCLCTPNSLSQPGGVALGASAGEATLRRVLTDAGFGAVRLAAETPFHMVIEARP